MQNASKQCNLFSYNDLNTQLSPKHDRYSVIYICTIYQQQSAVGTFEIHDQSLGAFWAIKPASKVTLINIERSR